MLIEIDQHIKVIRPEGKAIFPYSNSLYIDDKEKVLIDAGAGGKAYSDLPKSKLDLLLLTHYHFDHTHGIQFFPNARKMIGQEELWAFTNEKKFLLSSGYHHWDELMGEKKEEGWSAADHLPDDVPVRPGYRALKMDGTFHDGMEFQTGETRFTAIHTPGHSPGHYAFFFPDKKILFSADLDISPRGPWYGGEYSDFDQIVQSIDKLIGLKAEILVTSHRKVFYEDVENLLREYLDISLNKEARVLEYLSQPRSLDDLADRDLAFETLERTTHNVFWAKMMLLKHLQRLINRGQVENLGGYHYVRR